MKKEKILLVDDDPDTLEIIKYNLQKENYRVLTADNGEEAIRIAKKEKPDLVILDVMMPEMDGMEACYEMRKIPSLEEVLIVFLTARKEDFSQIAGFDAGADDYLIKPIKPRLLLSKIKALLRRNKKKNEKEHIVKIGRTTIDREKYIVDFKGKTINLPRKEFELLSLLMSSEGKVFNRDTIMDTIWGGEIIVSDRTIDVHIRKLREKLGNDIIKTIKGVGYKFNNKLA